MVPGIGMVRVAAGEPPQGSDGDAGDTTSAPVRLPRLPEAAAGGNAIASRRGLVNLALIEASEAGFFARQPGSNVTSELTLDPRLTVEANQLLDQPGLEQSSAVLVDVNDGRVLVMAGRTPAEPDAPWLAATPWAPAASVFKVVTAAALVEAGVSPEEKVCYHAGVHSVEIDNLLDHRRLDKNCNTLGFGVSKSQNAILAKLADRHLQPARLGAVAERFGFNQLLDFEAAIVPSAAKLPDGRLPFARTAAGFWSTTLSPLHGAFLAATIARGGTTPPLHVVAHAQNEAGTAIELPSPESRRVLDSDTARTVGEMMAGTTEWGTARLGFRDEAGRPRLPGVRVAGKTGTLSQASPYRGYSWFVGYAPVEKPEIAVAVLLANGEHSNLRAHQIAARLLQSYFHGTHAEPMLVAKR